jgi:hypothetical protein
VRPPLNGSVVGRTRHHITAESKSPEVYRGSQPTSDEEHRRYGDQQDCVVFDATYLSTAIQISAVGDGVLLLNPAVLTSDGEWEAWFFASWLPGARRYRSFLELLRATEQTSDDQ